MWLLPNSNGQLGLPKRNGLFVQPFDDALLQRLRDCLGDRLRTL